MNTTRYALEQNRAGTITYYISRTKWTPDLAAATLFQSPTNAATEITLLPDGTEYSTNIRTINLTPGKLIK